MYIDSHAHIYLDDFKNDISDIVSQAAGSGVNKIYMPNIDSTTIRDLHNVEDNFDNCHAMMGLHPCYVKENFREELDTIKEWLEKRKYSALGEVGVDLYWDKTFVDQQIEAFQLQISLAKEHGLAVIIHSRDSLDITINEIAKQQDGNLRGIFHCFNGTVDQGKRIVDFGFFMGIGGVITFKNAGVDKTVRELPMDNMVLETDAPFLAPVPHRGKQNKPLYIPLITEKLAEVKEVELAEIGRITSANCRQIFNY